MKSYIILFLLTISALSVSAQGTVYSDVLRQVEQNSTTLKSLWQESEAQKAANHTGLAPENPEIGFGYLWGDPSSVGNRKDVSISQTFDFPTTYFSRKKLSALKDSAADLQYRLQRINLLHSAQDICINIVYYNALLKMYDQQQQRAAQIVALCSKKWETATSTVWNTTRQCSTAPTLKARCQN